MLCELPGNGAPALVGFWRPRILLPRHVLAAMAGDEPRRIAALAAINVSVVNLRLITT